MQEQIEVQKKTARKRGPEPKPAAEKRSKRISVYFTAAEYQQLLLRVKNKAELSAYTRHQLFAGKKPYSITIPETNYSAWVATAGLANNLNQIVRKFGAVGVVDKEVREVRDIVRELRILLVGVKP